MGTNGVRVSLSLVDYSIHAVHGIKRYVNDIPYIPLKFFADIDIGQEWGLQPRVKKH